MQPVALSVKRRDARDEKEFDPPWKGIITAILKTSSSALFEGLLVDSRADSGLGDQCTENGSCYNALQPSANQPSPGERSWYRHVNIGSKTGRDSER